MARCPREGTRVKFVPNPASYMLYRDYRCLPKIGERGKVTSIPTGRGRATCMGGPGGGLVYVKWDGGCVTGVSSIDIVRGKAALAGASSRRGKRRR